MFAFGVTEAEGTGDAVEYLVRDVRRAALLEVDVVVDADPGQQREFLAAQPRDTPPPGPRGEPGLPRGDPGATGAQDSPLSVVTRPVSSRRCARGW